MSWFRLAEYRMVAVAALALFGCQLARNQSSITVSPDSLVIRGSVVDSLGKPLNGVEVSPVTANSQPLAVSDSEGFFEAKLNNRDLEGLQASTPSYLKFETPIGRSPALLAVVAVDASGRGSLDLNAVVLRAPGTVKGTISQYMSSQGSIPSKALSGAVVTLGHLSTVTAADGKFEIKNAPAGMFTLKATAAGLSVFSFEIVVEEGKETILKNGVTLYPPGVVDGSLSLQSGYSLADLIAQGHPYRRTFLVSNSVDAEFVRMATDRSALTTQPDSLAQFPWMAVQGAIDFDFESNGDRTMYFQFSDKTHAITSMIHSMVVPLDLFVSTGFVIDTGSGRVSSRYVTLTIDVPPIARFMRISRGEADLQQAEWRAVQPVTDFPILPVVGGDSSPSYGGSAAIYLPSLSGTREIFLQFSDGISISDAGLASLSRVFRSSAVVDLFPPSGRDVFTINGGATITTDRFVKLDITVPANAYQMRLFEDVTPGTGGRGSAGVGDWVEASPVFHYFFADDGLKILHLQFRDQGGFNSTIYLKTIRVNPFVGLTDPFVINHGDAYSVFRDLVITLNPPVNATSFRIGEEQSGFGPSGQGLPFMGLTPQFPILAEGLGLRTFYLQYRERDGATSKVYARSIYITPFPPNFGDFHINGGASVTADPVLQLSIIPPVAAREMTISDQPFSLGQNGGTLPIWQPVASLRAFDVQSRGFKTIYMKFRTDGMVLVESPVLVRNIIVEPLPPGSVDFVINAGSLLTQVPQINLAITAPPTAYSMRFAAGIEELPALGGTMRIDSTHVMNLPYRDGVYNVCLEVATFFGDKSSQVCHRIELQLFATSSLVMALNGEVATNPAPDTSTGIVAIDLAPPPAASWVRVQQLASLAELAPDFSGSAWVRLPLAPNTLTLTGGDGVKRVCVQYGAGMNVGFTGTAPEVTSRSFCKDIMKVP